SEFSFQPFKIKNMKYLVIPFCILLYSACTETQASNKKVTQSPRATLTLQTTTIQPGGITVEAKLPAQLVAYQQVSIFPKVNGYVKKVLVDIGSQVTQGQLLMTLEDPELEQASLSAKADYEKAQSDYAINKETYSRLLEAAKTPGAVSTMDLSLNKSKVSSSLAMMNAAKASWQEQETMLRYLSVRAPFSGIITSRNVNQGALVSNSNKDMPMLELKQISHLRLQIDVPEDIASRLKVNNLVTYFIPSLDNMEFHGKISRISNNVNTEFRSERIEVDVYSNGLLKPGMYADVDIASQPSSNVFHVPVSSVIKTSRGKYIIALQNNKQEKIGITTYHQSMDSIEIKGNLQAGEHILLNENS
ncbi:MAG TPA: efflux RND transporter periplasmic adaptor subunit, partial [Arachidicoccus soli]|nr:efflux RND transporter periplasmic adaptor subunit [Arachidicoccus soli]